MSRVQSHLTGRDLEAFLRASDQQTLLRFIACGSADDGKSALIRRLLYDSHFLYEDQLASLVDDPEIGGSQAGDLDFALLLDGLAGEREQGNTIEVAYRFFATRRRRFIVGDIPGHEQYTRNLVSGASAADAAVIVIDARNGVTEQTRWHTYLMALLGVTQAVLAVNKIDLMSSSQEAFTGIRDDFRASAAEVGLDDVVSIPISALRGDNVARSSRNTPWYAGPTLLEYLENVDVEDQTRGRPLRMPVQRVNEPDPGIREFCGTIVGGTVRPGDPVCVLPSGHSSRVARISTVDGDPSRAAVGDSVALVLADNVNVSRGDVICSEEHRAEVADQFEADIVWMHEDEMLPGRPYLMKTGADTVQLTIRQLKHKVNVATLEHVAASTLHMNEIGVCSISTDRPVVFDPFGDNRSMGGFVIVDRLTHAPVGAAMLHFALRRSHNVQWQSIAVTPQARTELMGHRPAVVWFTGLSGAGKSTVANAVEQRLHGLQTHTYLIDGDNVRHGLNRDLGFTAAHRVENVRRVAEMARLMVDAGLIVIVALISPFRAERRLARELVGDERFCEVFMDTPLDVAETRDRKGLYAKARSGQLSNFTGIDSPYEVPEHPEVRIDTTTSSPEDAVEMVLGQLRAMGVVPQ
jgi:bifunctional enzyme CysN/CysC